MGKPPFKKQLEALAKEVCVRLEKADKCAGQANDHRLAAALQLAKAREIATAESIPWKAWVAENIPNRSYRDVKRLVAIGSAKDPKAAIEETRKKKAVESKVARAEGKLAISSPFEDGFGGSPDVIRALHGLVSAVPPQRLEACQDAFALLDYDQKKEFLEWARAEMAEEEAPLDFETDEAASEEEDGLEPSVGGISDEDLLDIPQHLRRT